MKPKRPGNSNIPNFNELSDRLIADQPSGPTLVIRTNLDPKDSTENNPYSRNGKTNDPKAFRDYFEK